ncbi:MAG: SagB/ThcOx family dehydrogenase [Bacteroidales bacterium]|nr:SagB/ThcOx family dehydrogenase [Bacteroidales bacterium]
MKKTLILIVALMLAICGAYAQKKNTSTKNIPSQKASADGTMPSDDPMEVLETLALPMNYVGMHAPLMEALKNRRTIRELHEDELPFDLIGSLLWSAYGYNRPDEQKRVVPSAVNVQEFDIYLFNREGIYLYNAEKNTLLLIVKGDHRASISKQKHFAVAPISIVIVANYDRMGVFKSTEDRDFYAAVDAGYISQNIYLFCASADLGTVACGGINRENIHKLLNIKNGRAMLAHPVGMK